MMKETVEPFPARTTRGSSLGSISTLERTVPVPIPAHFLTPLSCFLRDEDGVGVKIDPVSIISISCSSSARLNSITSDPVDSILIVSLKLSIFSCFQYFSLFGRMNSWVSMKVKKWVGGWLPRLGEGRKTKVIYVILPCYANLLWERIDRLTLHL